MKIETIEQKIALRANENVQAKIKAFEAAIVNAMKALFGPEYCRFQFGECSFADEESRKADKSLAEYRAFSAVLRLAGRSKERDRPLPWPLLLWEIETEAIRNELMSKMDLMQQLLMARDGNSENDVPQALPAE